MKNKFWTMALSVLIAFGLWLYVITVVSPEYEETYYDIPVSIQNNDVLKERGLMITSEIPTVTLRLLGNRSDLINLNKANITVFANVAGIEESGNHTLGYNISYPGNIPLNSVQKQYGSPETITLTVENRVTKTIPVVPKFIGSVPEGFIADKENAVFDYTDIEVSGPESVLSQIEQAVVEVELDDQNKTIVGEFVYALCDAEGKPVDAKLVTTNVMKVNLTVKIQQVKEIKLAVEVVAGGGATSETCHITIEPATIRVSGSDTLLENLDSLNLGSIHLGDIPRDETITFPITLQEGITNETGVTDAKVTVEFPDLVTKSFDVTQIVAVNVPEGMEVDMITQALNVKIRGPKDVVMNMKDTDITATVDFTGAEAGTATMKPEIVMSEGFTSAGALNTYKVSATLQKAKERN